MSKGRIASTGYYIHLFEYDGQKQIPAFLKTGICLYFNSFSFGGQASCAASTISGAEPS